MLRSRVVILIMFWGGFAMTQGDKQALTLDDIFKSNQFKGKTVSDVRWLPDGSAFTFTRNNPQTGSVDIYRHDVKSGAENLVLKGSELQFNGEAVTMSAYNTTGNQNHLLITGPRRQIWRHSFSAPYFLYDMSKGELHPLAGGDPGLQNVDLSPNGEFVAFVKENNLHVARVDSGDVKALTSDGSFNILNGVFDWVYEEEFGRADAFRWSPDSQYIAFWRMDQTDVKTFTLMDEIPYYTQTTSLKYPKVGEANARVKIGVAALATGKTTWMDLGEAQDIYIPRIHWTNTPGQLAIQRLNRQQNHLELMLGQVSDGKTHTVIHDKNEAWVDVTDDFIFLEKQDRLVWTSEKSGFRHIYLSDYSGKELAQLTRGDWETASIIGVDEQTGFVYFNAKKTSPADQGLYRVPLTGGEPTPISQEGGWHQGVFSPNYQYYVGTSSNISTPPQVSLRTGDGELVRILEANPIKALDQYNMVYPELITVTTTDGVDLSGFIMKPHNFDPHKKYPVIVFGYGGPGSQMVLNRWGMGGAFRHLQRVLWHQYMTEQGYLVFCVDNRGTGGKGKAFKNLAYGDLSKWAVADQIEGAKHLASLPYVDPARIGFWGWSGGGYLTCMMLTRGGDYFKTGVAVASVSDFRNYDTIWTERYMGLLSDNKAGYDAANVLEYANGLKGNLLLIHGTGDDNVHPGNTLQFVDKLVALNKPFDLMLYPNRNHRIHGGNTSRHLHTLITRYFKDHL